MKILCYLSLSIIVTLLNTLSVSTNLNTNGEQFVDYGKQGGIQGEQGEGVTNILKTYKLHETSSLGFRIRNVPNNNDSKYEIITEEESVPLNNNDDVHDNMKHVGFTQDNLSTSAYTIRKKTTELNFHCKNQKKEDNSVLTECSVVGENAKELNATCEFHHEQGDDGFKAMMECNIPGKGNCDLSEIISCQFKYTQNKEVKLMDCAHRSLPKPTNVEQDESCVQSSNILSSGTTPSISSIQKVLTCDQVIASDADEFHIKCTVEEEEKILLEESDEEKKAGHNNIIKTEDGALYIRGSKDDEMIEEQNNFNAHASTNQLYWDNQFQEQHVEHNKTEEDEESLLRDSTSLNTLVVKVSSLLAEHLNSQENLAEEKNVNLNFNFPVNSEKTANILGTYNLTYHQVYKNPDVNVKQRNVNGCLFKNNFGFSMPADGNKNRESINILKQNENILKSECDAALQEYANAIDAQMSTMGFDNMKCGYSNNLFHQIHNNHTFQSSRARLSNTYHGETPYIKDVIAPHNNHEIFDNPDAETFDEIPCSQLPAGQYTPRCSTQQQQTQQQQTQQQTQQTQQQQTQQQQTQRTNTRNELRKQLNGNSIGTNTETSDLFIKKLLQDPKTKSRFFTLNVDTSNKKSVTTLSDFYKECSNESYTLQTETVLELINQAGMVDSTGSKNWFTDEAASEEHYSEVQAVLTLSENIQNSIIANDMDECKLNKYILNEIKKMQLSSAFNTTLSAIFVLVTMFLFY